LGGGAVKKSGTKIEETIRINSSLKVHRVQWGNRQRKIDYKTYEYIKTYLWWREVSGTSKEELGEKLGGGLENCKINLALAKSFSRRIGKAKVGGGGDMRTGEKTHHPCGKKANIRHAKPRA